MPRAGILQGITMKEVFSLFAGDDRLIFRKVIVLSLFLD